MNEVHYEPDVILDDVLAFLWAMAHLETTTPTLVTLVAAGTAEEEVARLLGMAISSGLVDAIEDWGPETYFVLSTLAAERMGIEPTYDSRRWRYAGKRGLGRLVGPHDPSGRYRDRRPAPPEDDQFDPMVNRVDARQLRPDEVLVAAEEAERKAARRVDDGKFPYDGDDPANAPRIHKFYGLGVIWKGEELVSRSDCPYCGGKLLAMDAYCVKCHNAGADRFIVPPGKSRRRQMPRGKSKLKGGV